MGAFKKFLDDWKNTSQDRDFVPILGGLLYMAFIVAGINGG